MAKAQKALILAGGLGSRLRPLTFAVPKALISVRDKPIIDYIVCHLVRAGFKDIYISVNYKSNLIKLYISDRNNFGVKIQYFDEIAPLGTAGPLSIFRKKGIEIDTDEPILVMNGDIITNLDFEELLATHGKTKADLTVGFIDYKHQLSYGVLNLDTDKNIKNITEKPTFSHPASAGIYVVSQKCLTLVPNMFFTMPDLISASLAAGLSVKGFEIKAKWIAIEQIKNLQEIGAPEKEDWISQLGKQDKILD